MNSQQIPSRDEDYKVVRRLCIAPDGYWWAKFDFSQLELRVLANLSRDPVLLRAFNEDGVDLHTETAVDVLGDPAMRPLGKALNFGLGYGAEWPRVVIMFRRLGMTIDEYRARDIVARARRKFEGVEEYRRQQHQTYLATGESRTLYGRRRTAIAIDDMNRQEKAAMLRELFNHEVQGTANDVWELAQLKLASLMDWEVRRVINLVHDDDSAYVPIGDVEFLRMAKREMESVTTWQPFPQWPIKEWVVPIEVDVTVGPNWADQRDLDDVVTHVVD